MTNPFLSHAFLEALESTGCAVPETGWAPHHITIRDKQGRLCACMPAWLKIHSQGEFVFDHAWADAWERAGGRYYPKYLCAVPFSPVTGRRLLIDLTCDIDPDHLARTLLQTGRRFVDKHHLSSFHLNFLTREEWDHFGDDVFLKRQDQQFHWKNSGYRTFQDFLDTLSSGKRRNLRKERAKALQNNIEIDLVSGPDITEEHWDAFYGFYLDTSHKKWGTPYLNRAFFDRIGQLMADNILLVMARREGKYIAGALNMIGKNTLYGRYWGATEHHSCLHFEVCYYQAIDYAIRHGLETVEAGAQGSHKLARGYLPHTTCSLHYISEPGFRDVLRRYLEEESEAVRMEMEQLSEHSPFRRKP